MDDIGTGRAIADMQAWKFCHGIRRAYLLKPSRRLSDDFYSAFGQSKAEDKYDVNLYRKYSKRFRSRYLLRRGLKPTSIRTKSLKGL